MRHVFLAEKVLLLESIWGNMPTVNKNEKDIAVQLCWFFSSEKVTGPL